MTQRAPSDTMKLLACGADTVNSGATEDLATFVDMAPYEYILVGIVLTGTITADPVTYKFVHSTASNGSSPVAVDDSAGNDVDIVSASPVTGQGVSLWVRTRGLNRYGSFQVTSTGAASDIAYVVYGVGVRDTKELDAHWTGTPPMEGAILTETATS